MRLNNNGSIFTAFTDGNLKIWNAETYQLINQ